MTDAQRWALEAFERVKQFSLDNAADFAAGVPKNKMDAIKAEIILLNGYMADQVSGGASADQAFEVKGTQRDILHSVLRSISDTAKVMEPAFDGIADKFKMPENRSDQNLLATARSWYTLTLPYNANFISYGLAADFRTVLNDAATNFEATITAPITAVDQRTAARALIEASIDRGKAALKILDTVMQNIYADQPGKRAAWDSASHIERPAKKKAPTTP